MTKSKKKSKHESESDSSSSSSSSGSDNKHKKTKKDSGSKEEKKREEKPSKSIWDSPRNQAQTSRHNEKRRDRERHHEGEDRDASRHRSHRDEDRRVDDRRHDANRGRRSPDRRDRQSPQERRRQDDSRDSRNNRRDDDRRKRSNSRERQPNNRRGGFNKQRRFNDKEEDDGNFEWGKRDAKKEPDEEPVEKDKPNFGLSGKLTEEANTVHGIIIKYAEPPEAKKPRRRWRLYPFKGETALPTLHIHRQSAFLIGRDRKICDIAVDHPSCSKQHAALQYRLVPYEREDGSTGKRVRPYVIDLESANGTFINNNQIEPKKFVELIEKDVIKFGFSSREYVLLHEASKDEAEDDEVADDAPETAAQAAD